MNRFDVRYMNLIEEKLLLIINKKATVTAVAEEMSVTRQTIYTWKARYQRFGIDGLIQKRKLRTDEPHNKTSDEIVQLIINTTYTYWQDGVEALSDHLQRLYNLTINPTTVYRILKREGIRYGEHHPEPLSVGRLSSIVTKYLVSSCKWIPSIPLDTNRDG